MLSRIAYLALAFGCLLGVSIEPVLASSIGINFASGPAPFFPSFDLAPTDVAGVVPQQNWNNIHSSTTGFPVLIDDAGNPTNSASFHATGYSLTNVPAGTALGTLFHTGISDAIGNSISSPYLHYDLYLYFAHSNNVVQPPTFVNISLNAGALQQFRIDDSGIATLVEATATSPGSYARLRTCLQIA